MTDDDLRQRFSALADRVARIEGRLDERAKRRESIIAQGPCGICGGLHAAHRMIDAQMERVIAGDHIESVAEDYDTDVPGMVAVWAAYVELLAFPTDGSGR